MSVRIWVNRNAVYLAVNDKGKRHTESTGLRVSEDKNMNKEIMRLAEVLRAKREIQLVQEQNGLSISDEEKVQRIPLYDYIVEFGRSNPNLNHFVSKVLPYLERFGGKSIMLQDVTPEWFERFQSRMEFDSGLASPHTQERYCQYVRQALKKAVRDGLIMRDPSSGIKRIRTPDSKKEFLTADEVRAMVQTDYHNRMSEELQTDIRRAFLFGCLTGFRVSDLIQLKWKDIDLEKRIVIKRQQKTKRIVSVPLKNEAWLLIDDGSEHDNNALIFPHLATTKASTNRYIHAWADAAGVRKNVSWHTARHTDATLLLENGADLYTVQRLLGHTRIQTTMQYAVVSDKKKFEAVDSLPDIGIKKFDAKKKE